MKNISPRQPEPQKSQYQIMIDSLRGGLNTTDVLYIVHTPVGKIIINRFEYFVPGFVAFSGTDEDKKLRYFVFSDEAICSFPLEVALKKKKSKLPLGFKPQT